MERRTSARLTNVWLVVCVLSACATYRTKSDVTMSTFFNFSDSESIYYEKSGGGSHGLILLHGIGASGESWDDMLPLLEVEKSTVVLVDIFGFGRSSKPKGGRYDIRHQSTIIRALVEYLGFDSVTLIGHSYGGGIALLAALGADADDAQTEASFEISTIVLIDPGVFPDHVPFFVKFLKAPLLGPLIMTVVPPRVMARRTLRFLFHDYSRVDRERIDRYARHYRGRGVAHSFVEAARGIVPPDANTYMQRYPTVKIPTLIIWGENDISLPVEQAYRLSEMIGSSELVIIGDCGHIPHEEKPRETADAINKFLGSRESD